MVTYIEMILLQSHKQYFRAIIIAIIFYRKYQSNLICQHSVIALYGLDTNKTNSHSIILKNWQIGSIILKPILTLIFDSYYSMMPNEINMKCCSRFVYTSYGRLSTEP